MCANRVMNCLTWHKVAILEKLSIAILKMGSNCAENLEHFAFAEEAFGVLALTN